MAGRIKGIIVEINGDTTKLSKALQSVDKNIKNTQTQLKDVEKLLKLDPTNTELLAQKQKLLGQAVQDTKTRLDALKKASEQAAKPRTTTIRGRRNTTQSSRRSPKPKPS